MTNNDFHTLYSCFDHFLEIFLAVRCFGDNTALSVGIGNGDNKILRDEQQIISDKLSQINLEAFSVALVPSEKLTIVRCLDDKSLIFELSLQAGKLGNDLSVSQTVAIDTDIPKNDEYDNFKALMQYLKVHLLKKVINNVVNIGEKLNAEL